MQDVETKSPENDTEVQNFVKLLEAHFGRLQNPFMFPSFVDCTSLYGAAQWGAQDGTILR